MNVSPTEKLLEVVVDRVLDKKGERVRVLDLRGLLDVTDWFVIATGFSELQMQAICDAVVDATTEMGQKPLHVEGREPGRWVLIDYVDVVVHLMMPEERDRFRLEALWGDAAVTEYDEAGNARLVRPAASREPGASEGTSA